MIDIHNHILPNIDDGPTNETEMMDLLNKRQHKVLQKSL